MADQHYKKARILLKKNQEGNCTEEEKARVEDWYLSLDNSVNELTDKEVQEDLSALNTRLLAIAKQIRSVKISIRVVAAVLFVMLATSLILWNKKISKEGIYNGAAAVERDVMLGTNRATLPFDNEDEIVLNSQQ